MIRKIYKRASPNFILMRIGQGLPVNMIVLTALALLVLVVVGAFFISGFGSAGASMQVVNATQASCQSDCQALTTMAYNYNDCGAYGTKPASSSACPGSGSSGLKGTTKACVYAMDCAPSFGTCTVTLTGGATCGIEEFP